MSISSMWSNLRSQWSSSQRRTRRRWATTDGLLGDRQQDAVSAYEQLFLELINRARANPTAEAARFGIALNEGLAAGTISTTPAQPLALNDALQTSIQGHLQDMIDHDFFSHTGSNGSTITTRINGAGYTNWVTIGENLAFRGSTGAIDTEASVIQEHQDLFVDAGIAGRGHRTNLLNANFKEAGAGVRTGDYKGYNSVFTGNDFGAKAGNSFLTGVVITDTVTANNFYNVGEGLAGISVVVKNGATTVASTTSNAAGGYQIQVPAGTYQVTFSGARITSPITKTFTIGTLNVKVDANTRTDVPAGPTVGFSASTFAVNEADGTKTITVNLSRAATGPITVNYATSNGTALAGSDYTATTGTLTFAAGETSKSFVVPITNDLAVEAAETINLTLSAPVGATLGSPTTAVLTIADNDVPSINFQQTAVSATEATTTATFTVTLSAAASQSITVGYSLTGGTATSGTDFRFVNGTLTFAPGVTSQVVTFTVVNDTLDENDETVQVTLASPTNAILGTATVATYTILDDDAAPSAKIDFRTSTGAATAALSVAESVRTISVPITLSAASARSITVNLGVAVGGNATAGLDFALPITSVTFAPGETSKVLTLNISEDLLDELNETINLALSSATAVIGAGSTAVVTILDNDLPPTVSFTTSLSSALESIASPGTVRVRLSAASGQAVTVKYAVSTAGTTAKATLDYTLAAGTLTFLPGETEKVIPLLIRNDLLREPTETIRIVLSVPTNATLGSLISHDFSILNND